MANKCAEVRYLNCKKTGHRINDCEELELCKICHDDAHTMANCPYFLYSANVEPAALGNVSYATAAKIAPRDEKSTKESKEANTKGRKN